MWGIQLYNFANPTVGKLLMPEPKRPLKVFLSYASQDKTHVRELSRRLVGEGWIDTWQDEKNLLPGQDWRVKIEEAVEEADVVIIVLSQHSVSKEGHVQKELRYAREIALEKPEDAIFLIPLRLDECEVPRGLRFYQWVDYFGEIKDSSYKALINSLKLRYEQKMKVDEAEHLHKEQVERKVANEKAEKETFEKARLKEVEEVRLRLAKEKSERETVENAAREKEKRDRKEKELRTRKTRESSERNKRDTEKKEVKPAPVKPKTSSQVVYWFGGVIVMALGIVFLSSLNNPSSILQPTPENTQTKIISTLPQATLKPSRTPTPKSTTTPANTLSPTPLLTEITDAKGVQMALVPEGEFTMGSDDDSGFGWSQPAHQVYLDAFYMDVYEVTNALYKACVDSGSCTPPREEKSYTRGHYYGNLGFDDYPVVLVDWRQAENYCKWRDASLPTEAQWEKSARGTDGRTYPWGEGRDCSRANTWDWIPNKACVGDTTVVGKYKSGKSIYGIYDLMGNVAEFTADWFDENYYSISPNINPLGPSIGEYKVVRGGSFYQFDRGNTTYAREIESVNLSGDLFVNYHIGIRCVKNLTP